MPYIIAITLLLAPAYAVKFSILNLSANLLMLWVFAAWIIFAIWLSKKKLWGEYARHKLRTDKKVLAFTALFLTAGIISLIIGGVSQNKMGQFIVLFVQPISLLPIASFVFKKSPQKKYIIHNTLYIMLAALGLYAILQYFTLLGLPPKFWGNAIEPKRAISFFSHPNFYALFIAPLLAFLIPDVAKRAKNWKLEIGNWKFIIAWLFGAFGLLFSMSRSGWLGLFAALIIYTFAFADGKIKKFVLGAITVMSIVVIFTPSLRWRLALPFYKEKSTVSRLSLWRTGWKAVKESPITGLGLGGFRQSWERLNEDKNLTQNHNLPHNIFLNFWVETGLTGLIGLVGLVGLYIYRGFKNRRDFIKLGISLFLVALLVQGQIDNPYFKNDLAMVFWIILSLNI